MAQKDLEAKKFFKQNKHFADAFNFCRFNGLQVIKPEDLRELDPNLIKSIKKKDKEYLQQMQRDISKELTFYTGKEGKDKYYCILGIEHNSYVPLDMIVRVHGYNSTGYANQVQELKLKHILENDNDVDFFSGLKKSDRLKPIVTLVINFSNKPWDAATSLEEILDVIPEDLYPYVDKCTIILLDPYALSDEDLLKFKTGLGAVLECIKHQNDGDLSFLNSPLYSNVDLESVNLIKAHTNIKTRKTDTTKEGGRNMCKAYEREKEKNIKEGIKIGIEIEKKRSEKRGIKIGEEKALKKLKKLMDKLVKNNIPFDTYRIVCDDNYRQSLIKQVNA